MSEATLLTPVSEPSARRALYQNAKPIFIVRPLGTEKGDFEEIYAIKNIDYALQAQNLAVLFTSAIEQQTRRLNLGKAKAAIDEYNTNLPKGHEKYRIGIYQVLQTSKEQKDSQVQVMVNAIMELLKNVIQVALNPMSVEQITASITDAFTNLNEQNGDAWIFWNKKEAHKTTYSYSILFAIQDEFTGFFMLALPMSMEIIVDLEYEQVLFIKLKDKTSYRVNIETLKIGQLLYSGEPVVQALRENSARVASAVRSGEVVPQENVNTKELKKVVVTTWSGSTVFARAEIGELIEGSGGSPDGVFLSNATIVNPLVENHPYLIKSSNHPTLPMLFNGVLPGNILWFVST